ncbi:MAG: hypothetical protein HS114_00660 [Anaerolineales bacterium]|nr:hypothetical protein [Anaerolineales bacterium]
MVRLTEEKHRAVRVRAAELGQPISEIVRYLLDLWLEGKVEINLTEREEKEEQDN